MNTDIKLTIDKLIALGEDKDELEFWLTLLPVMAEPEKKQLLENLQTELKALSD